ncbi:MAG: glycosyltransferase [bacterium]|nr:glycosyltransferase [bacterium]
MKVVFISIHGRQMAYSRVRCYNFAAILRGRGFDAEVLTFQENFSPWVKDDGMLRLGDREKCIQTGRALARLFPMRDAILYTQKAHWHAAAPFLLKRLGINRFILDYDDWDLDRSPFFGRDFLNRALFGATGMEPITAAVARRADACVASTSPLLALMRSYNASSFLISTGVDADRFKRKRRPPDSPLTIMWNGKVWGKVLYENLCFALDCYSMVRRLHPTLRFIIAGDGAWMGRVREYAGSEGIGGVEFPGWIEPDRMPESLERVHIGLLPLIPDRENAEWMKCKSPTKLFEYMAMGIPTVASRFGEVRAIINDGVEGFLASGRDEFISGLRLLVEDPALRERMGAQAREKVAERYCHRAMGDELVKVITYVAERRVRG